MCWQFKGAVLAVLITGFQISTANIPKFKYVLNVNPTNICS